MNKADHANTTSPPPGARPDAGHSTDNADPIFAVLAEHRAAMKAYLAASAVSGALADGTPEWETANKVTQAAIRPIHSARERATFNPRQPAAPRGDDA
jgi:hypothetical protein